MSTGRGVNRRGRYKVTIYDKKGEPRWSEDGFSMFEAARNAVRARERGHSASVTPAFDRDQLAELRERGLGRG